MTGISDEEILIGDIAVKVKFLFIIKNFRRCRGDETVDEIEEKKHFIGKTGDIRLSCTREWRLVLWFISVIIVDSEG